MKGQTVHLPKRAWRLGLFFIGIFLAGGVLLMYIPAWACPMKRSLCWSLSSAPSCSRSCLGITSSKKRRWPSVLSRLVPYCACLMMALTVGMVILHYLNDMAFAGSVWLFFLTQCFYIPAVGVMSLLFGWNAANPGVAASRMILFIPMGFILGGATSPLMEQSLWVRYFAHFFPLTWEYEFTRDITLRGAGFWDIAPEFGGFLIYFACLIIVFCLVFYGTRQKELARQKEEHA
ncbi:hypothetical protein ACFCTO_01720 [Megasphaera indica]